jgi:hypothetical protein
MIPMVLPLPTQEENETSKTTGGVSSLQLALLYLQEGDFCKKYPRFLSFFSLFFALP